MDRDKSVPGKMRAIPRSWIIAGMIVLAVPFVLFLFSMKGCACAKISADNVTAERTGADTIRIFIHPDASVHFDRPPVLALFVNDQEVSNRSLILHEGLQLAISPPEGLAYRDGASVMLQGKWVAGNASNPVHIWTVASYEDGEIQVIEDQMV